MMASKKKSTSTRGLTRMATALAAFAGITLDKKGRVQRLRKPPMHGPAPTGKKAVASKGVRSRRRRAAGMRAMGCKHVDGFGWLTLEDMTHAQE